MVQGQCAPFGYTVIGTGYRLIGGTVPVVPPSIRVPMWEKMGLPTFPVTAMSGIGSVSYTAIP